MDHRYSTGTTKHAEASAWHICLLNLATNLNEPPVALQFQNASEDLYGFSLIPLHRPTFQYRVTLKTSNL